MFTPDVVTLRQFYTTPFGERTASLIRQTMHQLWPDAGGDTMLGIGYALPYMEPYLTRAAPAIVCMPAAQGAVYWPPERANRVFLAQESELPLAENSVNRVLLIHSLETSNHLPWMMQEVWRVLTPGGRALAIVPNRLSLWARSSKSPFGYGRPFTLMQLRTLMTDHQFTVTRSASTLFVPPTRMRFIWRMAGRFEMLGKIVCPFLGGVLFLEAEKQLYAAIKQPATARAGYRPAVVPAAKPAMTT